MNASDRNVKIGVVGLGPRSEAQLLGVREAGPAEVTAVCDPQEDRIAWALELLKKNGRPEPRVHRDHRALLEDPSVEAVLAPSSWNSHVPVAIDSMRAGKYVAFEVSGGTSLDQLWEMVRTSERTGIPCMMLENCCYGRNEMMVMNLVRQGLFGELIYCECGYEHNLAGLACQLEKNKERAFHNLRRNADLYPTHGLGPISKILGINRGNRFLSLTSTATKARGFAAAAAKRNGEGAAGQTVFNKGDIITTVIRCANGESITMTHGVSLPRPYSRDCRVQGTKGLWLENANGIHIDGVSKAETWDPVDRYYDEHDHPLWKAFRDNVTGGHGGMDTLVLQAFLDAVRHGAPTPIDVYDCAAWMSVTCLSEDSIATGCAPVAVPDFTNGKWINRPPERRTPWALSVTG